jgi:lysophospholipase L1-like esterase
MSIRFLAAACAALLCAAPAAWAAESSAGFLDSPSQRNWVAAWSSAPGDPGPNSIDASFGADHSRSFENQTIREIAHVSVGGKKVRVRLSNAFGTAPLRIGAAHVALRRSGASIRATTDRRLTFSGNASIVIPVGAVAVSDAADLDVPGASDVAVSIYLPGATEPATYRETTLQTSYVTGTGNFTGATDLPDAAPTTSSFYLTYVEVQTTLPVSTLVAFGDSVTLGAGSTLDANRSWPEQLSARLNPFQALPRMSVINQGIGCGRLLFDFCGPGGAARFDRDALTVTGANRIIVALGINDIMIPAILPNFGHPEFAVEAVSANDIITGLSQLVQRARARGFKIYGATITPFGSSPIPGLFTPENEAKRQAVNRWIRTGGAFDGVIDFEAAVRDPANPARTRPAYDFDGVHMTDAGYEAMANAVNLSMLLF